MLNNQKKKERLMAIIMGIIMSTVMGTLATTVIRMTMDPQALAANPAPTMYLSGILESIFFGLLISMIVPFGKWGKALAARYNAYPPGRKFTMLNCIPISLCNSIAVSLIVSFINSYVAHSKMPAQAALPLLAMWLPTWAKMLIPSILISYIISVLVSPYVMKLVGMGGRPGAEAPGATPEGAEGPENPANK